MVLLEVNDWQLNMNYFSCINKQQQISNVANLLQTYK